MPFRNIPEGIYDPPTLRELQDIFEFTWLVITDSGDPSLSREDVARMIIKAHKRGLPPEAIKDEVCRQVAAQKAG